MKNFFKISFVCLIVIAGSAGATTRAETAPSATALTREELASKVQEKAKQLDDINRQLQLTRENLQGTKAERRTLQKELSVIDGNISQLNLGIKSDQINVQKLGLEIDAINYDIQDIRESIAVKRAVIEKTLVEFEKNERADANLLVVFLRNTNLANGVMEAQNLKNIQSRLISDIADLRTLRGEYDSKLKAVSDKKDDISFHQKNLQNKKYIVQDQKTERQSLLVATKDKENNYQKQLAELEKLQQQVADEVEALDAVLRTKIDPSTLPALGSGVVGIPVDGATKSSVTQGYGATSFAKYGYRGKWHNGVDFGSPIGTPVLAAEAGTVVALGDQDQYCRRGAYGRFIVIQHKNNLTTLYAHLSRMAVKKGDTVARGALIGYSGKTGYATGPHLHFTIFATPTFYMGPSHTCGPMPYGGDLNPMGYL